MLAKRLISIGVTVIRVTLILIAVISAPFLYNFQKFFLDRKMEKLCAQDAGVKVYERVTLPASRFGARGELLPVIAPEKSKNLSELLFGNEYLISYSRQTIKAGDPFDRHFSEGRIIKYTEMITRTSDKKILAEYIWYSRTGGEFIPWGRPSSTNCPSPPEGILSRTFIKGD